MSNQKDPNFESAKLERRRISRQRSRLYTASRLLFILFFLIFNISLLLLVSRLYDDWKSQRAFEELSRLIAASTTEASEEIAEPQETGAQMQYPSSPLPEPTETGETGNTGILEKYRTLYEMNQDMFGWISIEGTDVNYPVMYTPENEEYYLRKAFDGSYSRSGVPFVDADCYPGCGNYIIYGHNMFNGAMFTELVSYQDESYWKEHPVIRFDTLYEEGEYQVVAAFYSRVFYTYEKNVFRYYEYSDLTDPDVFDEFVTKALQKARYDTGIVPEYGDELITLITCSYGSDNERFVVVASKKAD